MNGKYFRLFTIGLLGAGLGLLTFRTFRRTQAVYGGMGDPTGEPSPVPSAPGQTSEERVLFFRRKVPSEQAAEKGKAHFTGYEGMSPEKVAFLNNLAFQVLPYVCLASYAGGLIYRRLTDPYRWNAKSTEILDKEGVKFASPLFHYGVLSTFVGHASGLLIPQQVFDRMGIDDKAHTRMAIGLGMLFGFPAFLGNLLLFRRRIRQERVLKNSAVRDVISPSLLLGVIGVGTYNVFFDHYYVLDTVAPWIRSIVLFNPRPEYMIPVPLTYKLHVLGAFILFAYYPFSRLIHSWSPPVGYPPRSYILFRSREGAS